MGGSGGLRFTSASSTPVGKTISRAISRRTLFQWYASVTKSPSTTQFDSRNCHLPPVLIMGTC